MGKEFQYDEYNKFTDSWKNLLEDKNQEDEADLLFKIYKKYSLNYQYTSNLPKLLLCNEFNKYFMAQYGGGIREMNVLGVFAYKGVLYFIAEHEKTAHAFYMEEDQKTEEQFLNVLCDERMDEVFNEWNKYVRGEQNQLLVINEFVHEAINLTSEDNNEPTYSDSNKPKKKKNVFLTILKVLWYIIKYTVGLLIYLVIEIFLFIIDFFAHTEFGTAFTNGFFGRKTATEKERIVIQDGDGVEHTIEHYSGDFYYDIDTNEKWVKGRDGNFHKE